MPSVLPIFLAYGDTSSWEIVVWLLAGVIGIIGQIATHKQKKEQQARQARSAASAPPPAARAGGGDTPTPDELAEIFKRLGASVPATPSPPVRQPAPPPPPPQIRRVHTPAPKPPLRKPAARVAPELAQRLARVKQEAAAAAAQALEAERAVANAIVPGVQSRAGETRALDAATRHTGTILPRLYAMSLRMAPLPTIPMPGLDRTHHLNQPMRTKLHSRREVRDALIAQIFLQPAKTLAR